VHKIDKIAANDQLQAHQVCAIVVRTLFHLAHIYAGQDILCLEQNRVVSKFLNNVKLG